jgi:hypothetical protein
MGEGNFGGDGSVAWEVKGGHVREHDDAGDPADPTNPKKRRQTGIDETPIGGAGSFEIEIKLPADNAERTELLTYFTPRAQQGGKIKFPLPIEAEQRKQVRISWNSRPITT